MKKQNILSIASCLFILNMNAQSTDKRTISAFTKIDASGAANITYVSTGAPSLSIEGNAEEIKQIETTVKNNVLYIKTKGDFKHPFKINISGTNLKGLELSGACTFVANGELKTDSLTIESSGASKIEMHLSSKAVNAAIGGASNLNLSGNTKSLKTTVSGASTLKAYDLKTSVANVTASGASSAQVYVTDKLTSKSSGASSVKYKGEPKDVDQITTSIN
ncbi:MAG: hypothetical protein K0S12_1983 [Bacteroidetes bacterium]|jgi:hypothetical protein|nr:hypothetical protein [Bacteroidota bacterium]